MIFEFQNYLSPFFSLRKQKIKENFSKIQRFFVFFRNFLPISNFWRKFCNFFKFLSVNNSLRKGALLHFFNYPLTKLSLNAIIIGQKARKAEVLTRFSGGKISAFFTDFLMLFHSFFRPFSLEFYRHFSLRKPCKNGTKRDVFLPRKNTESRDWKSAWFYGFLHHFFEA